MPFTFAHPAIVLPLSWFSKRWFSLTGLVIGSLIPDFEYFIRMKMESNYSHTILGVLRFDLPLGLIMAFIFHNIVRNPLILNSPKFFQSRFFRVKTFNWNLYFRNNWLIVCVSILIGASSHLFWDAFTHKTGFFVNFFPFLKRTFLDTSIPIFKILQHLSSAIGLLIIFLVVKRIPSEKIKISIRSEYWITFGILALLIFSSRMIGGLSLSEIGSVVVSIISAVLLALILTPLFLSAIKRSFR